MICENAELYGWESRSEIELLTIVAGSLNGAKRLKSLFEKGNFTTEELLSLKIRGINKTTAQKIKALYSFARMQKKQTGERISNSEILYDAIRGNLENLDHEEVWIILMDNANHIIKKIRHSTGGINLSIIDVKMIIKKAIECSACAMALAHNHPSGTLTPSQQDINSTNKVKDACKLLDIRFLDHIIVSHEGFYSFNDNDMLS